MSFFNFADAISFHLSEAPFAKRRIRMRPAEKSRV